MPIETPIFLAGRIPSRSHRIEAILVRLSQKLVMAEIVSGCALSMDFAVAEERNFPDILGNLFNYFLK